MVEHVDVGHSENAVATTETDPTTEANIHQEEAADVDVDPHQADMAIHTHRAASLESK